jgi:hypothetical protein
VASKTEPVNHILRKLQVSGSTAHCTVLWLQRRPNPGSKPATRGRQRQVLVFLLTSPLHQSFTHFHQKSKCKMCKPTRLTQAALFLHVCFYCISPVSVAHSWANDAYFWQAHARNLKNRFLLNDIWKFSSYFTGSALPLRCGETMANADYWKGCCSCWESYEKHCDQNMKFLNVKAVMYIVNA